MPYIHLVFKRIDLELVVSSHLTPMASYYPPQSQSEESEALFLSLTGPGCMKFKPYPKEFISLNLHMVPMCSLPQAHSVLFQQ